MLQKFVNSFQTWRDCANQTLPVFEITSTSLTGCRLGAAYLSTALCIKQDLANHMTDLMPQLRCNQNWWSYDVTTSGDCNQWILPQNVHMTRPPWVIILNKGNSFAMILCMYRKISNKYESATCVSLGYALSVNSTLLSPKIVYVSFDPALQLFKNMVVFIHLIPCNSLGYHQIGWLASGKCFLSSSDYWDSVIQGDCYEDCASVKNLCNTGFFWYSWFGSQVWINCWAVWRESSG